MHFPSWTTAEPMQGQGPQVWLTTSNPEFDEVQHLYAEKPLRVPWIYATNVSNPPACPHCGKPL